MDDREIYEALIAGEEADQRVALATVVRVKGSTPRDTGSKMIIAEDGAQVGTIGGGCGEAEVRLEAMEAHQDGRPRLVHVDLTNPIDGDDKICGGVMDVFVEPISPEGSLRTAAG